jgi:cytochrome c biogenesis protein CcmG, thiol:disulfide interchange protein DsbE
MPNGKTDFLLKAAIGLLTIALCWVVAGTLSERVITVGDRAPDFSIVTDSGRTVTRENFGGRVLVLNFWATWCPPCIEEMPSLDQFQKRLAANGVVVVGVSVDRNEKAYKAFLDRAKVSFQTARDPEARISADYGTFKYPETYIINSKGEVIEKFIGPENWLDEQLVERIRRLL